MDINRDNMNALFTGYNKAFQDAFQVGNVDYQEFTMEVGQTTKIQEFPFLEQISGMREWLGPRHVKNVSSKKLQVVARTFEDTVGLPVNDIEDDQYGMYTPLVGQMGANAANLPGELVFAALVANGNWLDGKKFFVTNRKYGDATIANYVTDALTPDTYGAARTAMMSYQGHGGSALKVVPNLLVVGPALEAMGKRILVNDFWYDSVEKVQINNPYKGTAKLQVNTQLVGTAANYWFMFDTRGVIKPVMHSRRQAPVLVRKDRLEDDNVFHEDKVLYGTKARGEAALVMPHLAYAGFKA